METVGTGKGVAALFNARAKRVTARVVNALAHALPDALVLVSNDIEQARRHAARIVKEKPYVVLAGGGDGSIARLMNLLRDAAGGTLPAMGTFKLGTGNAWARVTGATDYFETVRALPHYPRPLPLQRFDLVEVEGMVCHFAGVGWDARLLNDYLRNLDKRSSQLVGSRIAMRLHKGLGGYMYSLFRITVPEELAVLLTHGQPRATIENVGGEVFTLDSQAHVIPLLDEDKSPPAMLYSGPVSVAAVGTTPEWGFGFRAFPFAQAKPGYINVRVYDRTALEGTRNMFRLWRGEFPMPGMHDFYAKAVRMKFSRPMPFQIAGDGLGEREEVSYRVADTPVDMVDWTAARVAS